MSALNYDIPGLAIINHQILIEARNRGDLKEVTKNILSYPGYAILKDFDVFNQAQTMSLLYCVLVVPKELWRNRDDPIYKEVAKLNPENLFIVEESNPNYSNYPAYWLIHYLRNALAHINYEYEMTDEWIYTFWNVNQKTGLTNWKVKISAANLETFITSVGYLLANTALSEKNKR